MTHSVNTLSDMSPQSLGELQQFLMQQFALQQAQGKLGIQKLTGFAPATASCTSTTTITATGSPGTDITGATLTLASPGNYFVWGVFDFEHTVAGASIAVGELNVDGVAPGAEALLSQSAVRGTVGQVWSVTTTGANKVAKLAAWKVVGAGTLKANATHTNILAIRVPA